jgi:hypothetical protein
VSRSNRPLVASVIGLAVLVAVTGCGGGSKGASTTEASARKPPKHAEVPPPRLRSNDKAAFAAIQRASGVLRAAAVPAAYGSTTRIPANRLRVVAREVGATHPRNPLLRRLRATTQSALDTAASSSAPPKAIATAAIAEADRIDGGLRRYAASHPAANELAPG